MGSLQVWVPISLASPHGRSSPLSDFLVARCSFLPIIVHLCLYLFRFSIMFCFTCYGHLAIGMLGAVLVFYSVEWRDSFLSPPLNLRLSNRVFAFYLPDHLPRRAVNKHPYPHDRPGCRATSKRPYPPDRPRCRATSTRPYPPDCPRCRATSPRPFPPNRRRRRATSMRPYPPDNPHPRQKQHPHACLGPVSTPTASVISAMSGGLPQLPFHPGVVKCHHLVSL